MGKSKLSKSYYANVLPILNAVFGEKIRAIFSGIDELVLLQPESELVQLAV